MSEHSATVESHEPLDLVVVGAGPHSLSLICRLLESSPAEVFSDADHARLHYWKKNFSTSYSVSDSLDIDADRKRILVIDGKGKWMESWNQSFRAFNIKHLRSPMFFHPDPFDSNALRCFSDTQCRSCELVDISKIVDQCKKCKKKAQKSELTENDRDQFYCPSTGLFSDFCESLVDRYFIHDIITQGWVTDIIPQGNIFKIVYKVSTKTIFGPSDCCAQGHTIVENNLVKVVYARRVVCALGNSNNPVFPNFIGKLAVDSFPSNRIVHSIELSNKTKLPVPPELKPARDYCSLLVIGGGLTTAQLVDLAVQHGFKRIVMASRSKLKVKPFDVGIEWVGRNSWRHHFDFWNHDGSGRRTCISNAKNGGSITPEYRSILANYENIGILEIREGTFVSNAEWVDGKWKVNFSNGNDADCFDMIWLGTGSIMDVRKELCLSSVMEEYPTRIFGGLPELDETLKWPGLELYLMSGYSGLSIGPSAGNLFGGRIAARKIASKLLKSMLGVIPVKTDESRQERKNNLKTLATMSDSFVNYWTSLPETEV